MRSMLCLLVLAVLCLPGLALAGGLASEGNDYGTAARSYTRIAPGGGQVNAYSTQTYVNPFTSQSEQRVGPPANYRPGNWYQGLGSYGYDPQTGLYRRGKAKELDALQ